MVSFYDDQGTHHAAALTYYALMSLFPTLLLAVSLLGLLGEFPATYDAIVGHLRGVVPAATLAPLDAAVRAALKSKGTASVALIVAILTALYGATGYLEAARRALNVVFDVQQGRSFVRRKLIDIASTFVLLALVLVTLVLVFAGGGVAHEVLGSATASVWRIARWPGAFGSALLVFSYHLLRHARRAQARVPMDHARRPRRGGDLARRLGRILGLPRQLQELQRDLWLVRSGHHPARLVVAHQRRADVRRRGQRGDRARAKEIFAGAIERVVLSPVAPRYPRRRDGHGTAVCALVCEPSWNVNSAENGKPPVGQRSGIAMPMGWNLTSRPWTCL